MEQEETMAFKACGKFGRFRQGFSGLFLLEGLVPTAIAQLFEFLVAQVRRHDAVNHKLAEANHTGGITTNGQAQFRHFGLQEELPVHETFGITCG